MKRGQYDLGRKSVYFILVALFLTVMFIFLSSTFGKFDLRILRASEDASSKILMKEMVYSPLCFAYVDSDINRAYPGMIDISKFKNDVMFNTCGRYYKDKFGVYLFTGNDLTEIQLLTDTAVVNKRMKSPTVLKVGNVREYANYIARPVIVKNDEKEQRGVLVVGFN